MDEVGLKMNYTLPTSLAILLSHLICQNYLETEHETQR